MHIQSGPSTPGLGYVGWRVLLVVEGRKGLVGKCNVLVKKRSLCGCGSDCRRGICALNGETGYCLLGLWSGRRVGMSVVSMSCGGRGVRGDCQVLLPRGGVRRRRRDRRKAIVRAALAPLLPITRRYSLRCRRGQHTETESRCCL